MMNGKRCLKAMYKATLNFPTLSAQRPTFNQRTENRVGELRGRVQPFNILFWQADAAHEVGEARIGAEIIEP